MEGKRSFVEVEKLQGEVFRALETRKTLRFSLAEKSYFIKIHYGTTLKEVLKNLISFRIPVLGADREWKAIHRLYQLDVDTMKGIGFGQTGANPLTRKSFIITEDLAPTISLEDYCADWEQTPPDFRIKRMLIKRLATMVRKMHRGGVNHRDCYICHFLLHLPFDGDDESQLKLSVIDLHRSQIRDKVPQRWRDKDLIGLYFSSSNIGLNKKDILYFLKIYFDAPLRQTLTQERELLEKAITKSEKIKERTIRKSL